MDDIESFSTAALHLRAGKYFQLAGFVVLVFDHMLTFSDEVERIWKRKISWPSILFLLNRYFTPLQFIIIIVAFHDPKWTGESCRRFSSFEAVSTIVVISICELIMILRVYALYSRSRTVLIFLMSLWSTQIALSGYGLTYGFTATLPPGFIGCIFTGSKNMFPAIWVAPLITDSCIFFLTIWHTRGCLRHTQTAPTIYIFVRDGMLYYLTIFIANLLNTLLFFLAPEDLKAVGASFSQLITSTIISRLVLNLRSISDPSSGTNYYKTNDPRNSSVVMRSVGSGHICELDSFTFTVEPAQPNDDVPVIAQNYSFESKTGQNVEIV